MSELDTELNTINSSEKTRNTLLMFSNTTTTKQQQTVNQKKEKLLYLKQNFHKVKCFLYHFLYHDLLSYFDTSVGVKTIVAKSKWVTRASKFKQNKDVSFPPSQVLCDFISEAAISTLNDPKVSCEKSDIWKPNQTPYKK